MSLADIHVLLVGTTHPGNVGSAARALKTMGLEHLHLVDGCAVDEQAYATAGSADDVLAAMRRHVALGDALAGMARVYGVTARERRYGVPALTPREAAAEIAALGVGSSVALLFGREHSGLTNDETGHCHRLVHIPANPAYSSLNLAAAVQVLCYEMRVAAMADATLAEAAGAPAPAEHVAGFYEHLSRVMARSGYAAPEDQRHLMQRLRRLFNRSVPERAEINILRGILAAVERRLPPDGSG